MAKTSGTKLVIVESPTKAKTIRKFLGRDYIVESCMGHIRDLPQSAKDIPEKLKKEAWAKLGVNVDKNFEPLYCIPKDKVKVIKNLREKLAEADAVYLATDEDREGESISWHLFEVLKPKVPTKRMVFHEITKAAIEKSLTETREIDENLVRAQEARRILDRLVGYTISPLLWKKVAYGLSAGRVQSVAVRLIVEREAERIRFKKSLYFGLDGLFSKKDGKENSTVESRLLSIGEQRVATGKDFDGITGALTEQAQGKSTLILTDKLSEKLLQELKNGEFSVADVEEKPTSRKPYPPFITSTLQQESNRKLGLSSRETMQVAQKLYEQGFITYMRTDSTFLSKEAIEAARSQIQIKYGKDYLPASPRTFEGKKVKGAQEAHEAIRPAGTQFQDPDETGLSGLQFKLYELIWKRTMACQMTDSRQKQVSAKMTTEIMWSGKKTPVTFNATGTTIEFPGFLRAYVEGSDDPEGDLEAREIKLPQLVKGEKLTTEKIEATSHETKPPARYTEASLVQMMEREGIGRPSTYASIMGTIVDRGYVRKLGNALIPTFTAMIVSKLLTTHLNLFVNVDFTSKMESSLDDIADGDLNWEKYLSSVYSGVNGLQAVVEREGAKIDPVEARQIKLEGLDAFEFHVGRFGAYVKTKQDGVDFSASIPDAEAPADMTVAHLEKLIEQKKRGADSLGVDDKTGRKIYVLSGRYGAYVQKGESDEEDVKRTSLPQGMEPTSVNLEMALQLLALPMSLGLHPSLGKDIKAGLGRFGPYVVCDGDYRSIPKTESIFTMTFERALEMLSQPKKGRGKAAALKDFGIHPKIEGLQVQAFNGPYGVYLKAGKTNVGLPEGVTIETLTDQQAFDLVTDKIGDAPVKTKAKPKKEKTTKTPLVKEKLVIAKAAKAAENKKAAKVVVRKK